MALYADTLQKLHQGDLDKVAGRLDWVLKLRILQQAMAQRPSLRWDSPEPKLLDHLYSSLDPSEGLYWVYEKAGAIERVASAAQIERFVHEPPEDTRAFARAMLLRLVLDVPDFPATIHRTEITADAKTHYHRRLTEVYYILQCGPEAALELDGRRVAVRPGMCALIRPGVRHRALGPMTVLIVVVPKFDPADEVIAESNE